MFNRSDVRRLLDEWQKELEDNGIHDVDVASLDREGLKKLVDDHVDRDIRIMNIAYAIKTGIFNQ